MNEWLRGLAALPGATYSCVLDFATGAVLDGAGAPDGDVLAAREAVAVAARLVAVPGPVEAGDADELDDMMIVSRRRYHLLRPLGAAPGRPLFAYLTLDRSRSNLAVARRALAAAPDADPAATPSPAGTGPVPAAAQVTGIAGAAPPPVDRLPVVPLPRRPVRPRRPSPAPRPAPVLDSSHSVFGQRWADDVPTLRRLLVGLRELR